MFSKIEKEYKSNLQERRFFVFYWPKTVFIIALAAIFDLVLGANRWIVYGVTVVLLIALIGFFFVCEFYHAYKTIPSVRTSKGISAKLAAFNDADSSHRIHNLAVDLAHNRIHTKHDLELTLDFFQNRLPVNSRPNLLEWTLTVLITLSSITILAYDDTINTINIHRLVSVFGSALAVALFILTPFIFAKLIATGISRSRNKIDTILVEDLAYIYVHFDQFEHVLSSNRPPKTTLA